MKKTLKLMVAIALAAIMTVIMTVSASASYYDHTAFSFTNYNRGVTRTYDGSKMAFEATVTSSNVSYITVQVHVEGYATYSYDVPTNCGMVKYDQIPMGSVGDHRVYFTYSCNGTANVKLITYSWVG